MAEETSFMPEDEKDDIEGLLATEGSNHVLGLFYIDKAISQAERNIAELQRRIDHNPRDPKAKDYQASIDAIKDEIYNAKDGFAIEKVRKVQKLYEELQNRVQRLGYDIKLSYANSPTTLKGFKNMAEAYPGTYLNEHVVFFLEREDIKFNVNIDMRKDEPTMSIEPGSSETYARIKSGFYNRRLPIDANSPDESLENILMQYETEVFRKK